MPKMASNKSALHDVLAQGASNRDIAVDGIGLLAASISNQITDQQNMQWDSSINVKHWLGKNNYDALMTHHTVQNSIHALMPFPTGGLIRMKVNQNWVSLECYKKLISPGKAHQALRVTYM